jgi:hypothetical protein
VAPASVPASAVEASSAEAPSMETAKAGLSSEGIGSGNPSMVEPTEGAGVRSCLCVRGKTSAMRIGGTIEVRSRRVKTVAIDNGPTVRNIRVVVVDDSAVVAPIVPPIVPTPAESAK